MLVMVGRANRPGQGQVAHSRVWAQPRGSGGHDGSVFGGQGLCHPQHWPKLGPGWQQPGLWNNSFSFDHLLGKSSVARS